MTFHGHNPVAIQVDEPGSDSPRFTVIAHLLELYLDIGYGVQPGDIARAVVDLSLVPVGRGPNAHPVGCTGVIHDVDYDSRLTVTCDFDDVPVNTYTVQLIVEDGYYNGISEDVVTVYDPSSRYASGAGTLLWPGSGEETRFGFTMDYNEKGTRVQGALLLIRHLPDGSIYKVKSNALYGLALGEVPNENYGWVSFSGKATYNDPALPEELGNHKFKVYVEDRNEPGFGVDHFWIEVIDKDGQVIPESSMEHNAEDHAVDLADGNVVVPHH